MPNIELPAVVSPNAGGAASLQEFEIMVRNLSNSGVTLSIDSAVDEALKIHPELMLSLSLPGQSKTYSIACIVRNRDRVDDAIIYSCEYDWSATMDPLGVVEDLLEYVLNE